MENSSECVEAKTPRRTRRSSATDLGSVSKAMRSAKTIKMPEIEEAVEAPSALKTPSHSSKQLEFRTPSKSEAVALAQTPRRSARKSIKPIQEYENIVAQKGLKRAASSTQDDEEPTDDYKCVPAVIGRGTTKRGKKSGRGKGKNIKRQRRFTEDGEDNEEEHCDIKTNDLETHVDVLQSDKTTAITQKQLLDDYAKAEKNDVDSEASVINREELLVEKKIKNDHEEQNQEESENKKDDIEVDQISSTTDKSLGGKENVDCDHDSRNASNGAAEEKVDIDAIAKMEDDVSESKVGLDNSQEVQFQDETVSLKGYEDEDNQLKSLPTEETLSKDVCESVKSVEHVAEEPEDVCESVEFVQHVAEEEHHEVVDAVQDSLETLSVKANDKTDNQVKSPSVEEAASKDECESVNEKQISNAEETHIECGPQSVEDITEKPGQKEEHQEVVDAVEDSSETVPVKGNENADNQVKSPSAEETPPKDECESVNKKQISDAEETNVECEQKSVADVTEKPSRKEDDHQEVVDVVDSSDNSMESGDVELASMPITADDSMDSPMKETQPSLIDESSNHKSLNDSEDENLDDSDCIMLSLDESSNTVKSETVSEEPAKDKKLFNESTNSTDMPSLMVCSDDEDGPIGKSAEIKSNEAEQFQQADASKQLNNTFEAEDSPEKMTTTEAQHTPVMRPSISHVPTPFKSKALIIPDIVIEPEEDLQNEEPPTVLEESRVTRIKSSRKRSFSVCGDRPKRNVTFYSPANTTVSIYDGDLMNSCKKADSSKKTNHRKRSLSVTETEKEMIAYIKQKKVPDTPESKKKQHLPASKTKMPNFSAIHQHQFKKMESISDHVARKAERAKVLSNSALKAKPASISKGLPVKNSVLRDCNKDGKSNLQMPKARQRIELSGIEHKQKAEHTSWPNVSMKMRTKSRNYLSALDDISAIDKLYTFSANNLSSVAVKPKLPKPRMDATTANSTGKTLHLASKTAISITAATVEAASNQTIKLDTRPEFNLSTAPESQSFRSTKTLNDRRKRLMEMYKSRNHPRTGEKNREILKGVRTNRRFELQMMCRNRPN